MLVLCWVLVEMSGEKENDLYDRKWLVGNAVNSMSVCKDTKCLYESNKISKGELRIGRRFPSPFDKDSVAINWFHAKCMFSQQLRSRQNTQVIEHEADMDGFDHLLLAEKHYVRDLIQGNVDIKFSGKQLPNATPIKNRESVGSNAGSAKKAGTPAKAGGKTPKTPSTGRRDAGRILML